MDKDPLKELSDLIMQGKIKLPPVGPLVPKPKKDEND